MKITNRMLYDQLNKDIAQNTEKLFYLNNQISSGKRITKPSDDPLGLSRAYWSTVQS
jgi:flagellar hook-associated protein 3 FlgL